MDGEYGVVGIPVEIHRKYLDPEGKFVLNTSVHKYKHTGHPNPES